MTRLIPAIFFGHGNPMNAISSNAYTGNLVHNLHTYAWGRQSREPYDCIDGGSISMLSVQIG